MVSYGSIWRYGDLVLIEAIVGNSPSIIILLITIIMLIDSQPISYTCNFSALPSFMDNLIPLPSKEMTNSWHRYLQYP